MEDTAEPLSPAALMVARLGMVGTLLESSVLVAPRFLCAEGHRSNGSVLLSSRSVRCTTAVAQATSGSTAQC